MIRHLTTVVLCGALGSMVLVGNAQACHFKKCGHAPVACAAGQRRHLSATRHALLKPGIAALALSCRRFATRRPPRP